MLESHYFFIGLVSLSVVSFLLVVSNVCLVWGAVREHRNLISPWLVINLMAWIALLVVCSVTFK